MSCRVCLSDDKFPLTSLDELISEHRTVGDIIEFISGIELSADGDNFPQFSCFECLPQIISACRIKEVCLATEKILRSKIKDEEEVPAVDLEEMSMNEVEETEESVFEEVDIFSEDDKVYPQPTPTTIKITKIELKCYLCDMRFRLKREKNEHLETMHGDDELKCKLCRHKSQTSRGLENHVALHFHPELLSFMCEICSKSFQKACELRRHIKLAHGDKVKHEISFFCDHCEFKTFSKMNMKRHLSTIHLRIKAFSCKFCPDKHYTSKITLEQHMITKHNQESDFVCLCCQRKFPTMSFLRSHMKSTCSGSPASARRERGDPSFYRERLSIDSEHYRCKLCGFTCEGKGKIAQHYAQRHKHSNACELCGATFNSYSNLKKHIQILHKKIHKYSCSFCTRTFGQKNQLQSHVNTHTGDKPFKCKFDFCSFRSGDLSATSKHQKKCSNNPLNKIH